MMASRSVGRFSAERLFRPESLIVVGAGTQPGRRVLANIAAGGFGGRVIEAETLGDISDVADLAILAGPVDAAAVLPALAAHGCFAAIALGAVEGALPAIRATGVRLVGSHAFGLVVPKLGLDASESHLRAEQGRLALISQSSGTCRAVLDWAGPNGVGFSHIVGIGTGVDLGFSAVLDYLSRDPGTGTIVLDIRTVKNPRAFLSAARAAARLRPMVAISPGHLLADPSGEAEAAIEAALRRAGVLSVQTIEDLLAAAETLTHSRPARGDALAIVSNALGPGRLAADAAVRCGLPLATFDEAEAAALQAIAPDAEMIGLSGLLYAGIEEPIKLAEVASMLVARKTVGGVLVVHAPTGSADDAAMQALAAAHAASRVPLLVCAMGETTGSIHRDRLADAGVPAFSTPQAAVRGFLHLVQDRRNRAAMRELPPSAVLTLAPDREEVRRILRDVRADGRSTLAQDEALAVLGAYGLPSVPGRIAWGPEDAADAASLLGFPVVVKLRRTSLWQGTRRGGLSMDLHTPEEVADAAGILKARAGRVTGDGEPPRFLVQKQVGRARELLIRLSTDRTFGSVLSFGAGGTAADVLHDIAVDLPPLNLPLAHGLIGRTKVAATFGALRDHAAANVDAIAEALVRVSQLVVDFPEIDELDVNPLFADADGVAAADAWMRLRPIGDRASRLAIAPYPAELERRWIAAGQSLLMRPIRPEDAEAHAAFFGRLSPQDVRYRFFTAMRELSPEQMARLTQVDYDREMAFVAVDEATGDTVGVARLVREGEDADTGEFAVIVQADMKGRGVASRLMRGLIDWAREVGVHTVVGQVLADNAPMLAFVRHLGFEVHRLPYEQDVVEARMELTPRAVA
jgi:acetyltransferase